MQSLLRERAVSKNKYVPENIGPVDLKGLSSALVASFAPKLPGQMDFAGLDFMGDIGLTQEVLWPRYYVQVSDS